jgi:glycosyltransferase involved in cell wall biosynthesis
MFLEALRGCGRIHAIMFDDGVGQPVPHPEWIDSMTWIPATKLPPQPPLGFWEDVFSLTPRMLRGRRVPGVVTEISNLLENLKPDKLIVYRIEFAVASGLVGNRSVFLDIDDPEHIRRLSAARVRGPIDLRTRLDLLKLRWFERRVVRRCRQAFVCQEQDAKAFVPPATVVPNTVVFPQAPPARDPDSKTVLFVGNLSGMANRDGLLWFVNHVWPVVLDRQPDCILRVVGKEAETVLNDDCGQNIQTVGFVEDIGQEYRRAHVAIAPIRFGTGTRIKILEAMSYGCPVISTPEGWDGIAATPGADLVEARDVSEMAAAIDRMITEPEWAQQIGSRGRLLVQRVYDRDDVIEHIRQLIGDDVS